MAVLQRGADARAEVRDHRHVRGQSVHLVLHLPEVVLHLPDGVWEGKGAGESKGDDDEGGRRSPQLETRSRCSHTHLPPSQKRLGRYSRVALMVRCNLRAAMVLGHSKLVVVEGGGRADQNAAGIF